MSRAPAKLIALTLTATLCALLPASHALAQQERPASADERPAPSPELETSPEGNYLRLQQEWPADTPDDNLPYVDRRGDVDPMASTAILWPTAYTPEQGTITYTNFFLIGNTLSYAITDSQQLGVSLVLPSLGALHAQGTYRIRLHDGPNHIVTLIPAVHYQTEGEEEQTTTSALSAGAGVVADFYLSDRFVLGIGAHFQGTITASVGGIEPVDCPDRDAFLRGECDEFTRATTTFPAGGHWLSVVGHGTYYIEDWLNLRAEVFTGGVFGTFLGTEYLYGRERVEQRSERYEDGDFALGIPYDSTVTAGLGTGLSADGFAIQLSGYVYYWDEEVRLTPMFSGTVAF